MLTIGLFCLMNASSHFLFGPAQDVLDVTREFGLTELNASQRENYKDLCRMEGM